MQFISTHIVLVSADDREKAYLQVQKFFKKTQLVHYDAIDILKEKSFSGTEKKFSTAMDAGIKKNRSTLNKFIQEFKNTGFETIADLNSVTHGYPSKLLHIITHFLDGFIGVDTTFYNLIEDSHWVSDETYALINNTPGHYWVITLNGYSETPDLVALVQQ